MAIRYRAIQYAEWGKFGGAWFAVLKADLDVYLSYENEKGQDIAIGFLMLDEAQDWLKMNRPKQFRLVYVDAETTQIRWGDNCVVVFDVDADWIPGKEEAIENHGKATESQIPRGS